MKKKEKTTKLIKCFIFFMFISVMSFSKYYVSAEFNNWPEDTAQMKEMEQGNSDNYFTTIKIPESDREFKIFDDNGHIGTKQAESSGLYEVGIYTNDNSLYDNKISNPGYKIDINNGSSEILMEKENESNWNSIIEVDNEVNFNIIDKEGFTWGEEQTITTPGGYQVNFDPGPETITITEMNEISKEIQVKIDMTVLWGADLPETVYMFAYNVDGSGNASSDVEGLTDKNDNSIEGYDRDKKGTSEEQTTAGALALTDEDGDGFYEGTLNYEGYPKSFYTRFYVANDEYNIVNMPKYEEHTGSDETPITDDMWFRKVEINDSLDRIDTAWENKPVESLEWAVIDQGDVSVYENFTRDLQVLAKYENTKADHRLEITEYINWESTNENIFNIYTVGTIKGINQGSADLNVERGDKRLSKNIEVLRMTEMEKRQYIMAIPDNEFGKVTYGIKGISGSEYGGNQVKSKMVTDALEDDIYNNSEFGITPLNNDGIQGDFDLWTKGNESPGNVIYIPRELNDNQEMESLEVREKLEEKAISEGKLISEPKVPVRIKDVFVQKNGSGNSFFWIESKFSEYKQAYDRGQDIFFRVSKIDSESSDVSFFEGNPLKKVEDHIQDYKDNNIEYIDFLFNYNNQNTIVKDGITAEYTYENFVISGLPLGEYRLQIYTMKKSSDYFVFSFDEEVSFQTPQEPVGGLQVKDNYIFESIDAKAFSEIKVNFLTRTKEDINLTKEDISYNGFPGTLAERHYGNTGEEESMIDGKFALQESADLDVIKYPLDVILCLDTSSSMSDDLENLKSAWEDFEDEMSQKSGFDINYKLVTFGNSNDSDIWVQGNEDEWFESLDLSSINTGTSNSSQEPSAAAILKATEIMASHGRSMDRNWTIIDGPSGEIKSQKMIIFVSDSNTKSENPTPDDLGKKIIDQNIFLTGIGGVKKDGRMIEDDLGDTAHYPVNKNNENEQHYYHLKLILGDRFKFYQMGSTSDKYEVQLKESISRMPIIKKWTLSYFSPYSLPDGKTRKILFDVADLEYYGKSDRKYTAPYRETTEEPDNQTVILKFDDETVNKLTETNYKYYISDNKSYWNTFRKMKTVNIGENLEDAITSLNYSDSGSFSLLQSDNDRQWEYNGFSGTVDGMIVNKVSSLGYAIFNRYNEDMEFEELFRYGFTEGITLNDPVEKGSKVELNFNSEGSHNEITFNNKRIMFRLAKSSVANYDTDTKESDIRYDLFEKLNSINIIEDSSDQNTTGDAIGVADQKMIDFYEGNSNYVDVIFNRSSTEGKTIYAGGAKFMFNPGTNLVINGLRMDNYTVEAYTMKESDHTTTSSAIDYKVVTFSGAKSFEIGAPDITNIDMSSNGVFKITETDVTKFPEISLEVATLMPHKVDKLTNKNLFEKESLIGTTGEITRMSEKKMTSGVTQDVLSGDIGVAKSDMSKDFQYPLDIIFCIDNSGSMQKEIDAVKDGLQNFSNTLVENGFDVKFNLITFGPKQNTTTLGNGSPEIYFDTISDNDYGAIFKSDWYESSSDGTAVKNLISDFDEINASGGFIYYQENGLTSLDEAIDKLKNNGRSINSQGDIINDSSGMLPSKKWIIMLTDENADQENLPDGYYDDILAVTGLVDKMADSDIIFTNIYHVDKYLSQDEVDEYSNELNIEEVNGVPYIFDDRGIRGELPSDTSGVYYSEFRLRYPDNYNMYEMGKEGQHVGASLQESVNDIGIVQFWKFDYETPFGDQDGTERHINFVLGNLEAESPDISTTLTPDDGNTDSDRRYFSPDLSLEIEFTTPNPEADSPEFESSSDNHFKIKGRVRSVNDSELVPDPPVKVDISIFDNATGDQINFGNNRDDNLEEEDPSDSTNDWYIFEVEVPKEKIRNSGYTFFDVRADGFLENGNSTSTTIEEVKFDNEPPVINSFKVRNLSLENFWSGWPDPDQNYYIFGTNMDESSVYGKNEDNFQINLNIEEANLSKVILTGQLERVLDVNTYTSTTNLNWDLDGNTNEVSFGSGDLNSNDLSLNQENDGKYEIKITAIDKSGNTTEQDMEFIVDNTSPVSIELINDKRVEYSNSGFSIELENIKDNDGGSGIRNVVFGGEYNDKYSDIASPSAIEYKKYISSNGVDEDGKASLNQTGDDGRYRFKETTTMAGIVAVDKAGNKRVLDNEKSDDFVDRYLDTRAPRVSGLKITKVTDGNGISELEDLEITNGSGVVYPGQTTASALYLKDGDKIEIKGYIGEWALEDIENYSSNTGSVPCYISYMDYTEDNSTITPDPEIEKSDQEVIFAKIEIKGTHGSNDPIKIKFEDKAGNSTDEYSFDVELDNMPPNISAIKPSYWSDSAFDGIKNKKVNAKDYPEDVWYTHSDNFDIKVNDAEYWGNKTKINSTSFSAIDFTTSLTNGAITMSGRMDSNELNIITAEAIDLAGNIGEYTDYIVLDTEVNGNFGAPGGVVGSGDTITIDFENVKELSGLYKYKWEITSNAHGTDDKQGAETVFGDQSNRYTIPTEAGDSFNVEIDPDLTGYSGSRFRVMVDVWDQLGNKATLNAGEYVVKEGLEIKSTEKDGERQVTTEVDLGGSGGTIDLEVEGRKEGGKKD
ncbi:MAG: vWA domain-containing protein [Fusobacteriota bacterium]